MGPRCHFAHGKMELRTVTDVTLPYTSLFSIATSNPIPTTPTSSATTVDGWTITITITDGLAAALTDGWVAITYGWLAVAHGRRWNG